MSLSVRRAWIEMLVYLALIRYLIVALRKESVDRNNVINHSAHPHKVALRKESVDRNTINKSSIRHRSESLSVRRAWIEI